MADEIRRSQRRRDNWFLAGTGIFLALLFCTIMWLVWTAQVMHPN